MRHEGKKKHMVGSSTSGRFQRSGKYSTRGSNAAVEKDIGEDADDDA